jgi:hypothetical protein
LSDIDLRFVVVRDPAELQVHLPAWEDLSAHAIEANPFYEPFMLLPALDAFGKNSVLQFVLIYAVRGGRAVLVGFLPMERASQYKGLPLAHLRLWMHRHCYLCTPLIRRGQARRCLSGYLDWLATDGAGVVVEWRNVNADGAFLTAFTEALADTRCEYVPYDFERALLRPRRDSDSLLKETHSRKARHELRRSSGASPSGAHSSTASCKTAVTRRNGSTPSSISKVAAGKESTAARSPAVPRTATSSFSGRAKPPGAGAS